MLERYGVHSVLIWSIPIGFGFMGESFLLGALFGVLFISQLWMKLQYAAEFEGYGVASRINELCRRELLKTSPLSLGGLVPSQLLKRWGFDGVIIGVTISSILLFDRYILELPPDMIGLAALIIISQVIAAGVELYLWFAVDRERLWLVSQGKVLCALRAQGIGGKDADALLAKLRGSSPKLMKW